jgi:CTP synthase
VIALMAEQENVDEKGGTMRLGAYACDLVEGSKTHALYGTSHISERHRHRYEFNNEYLERFNASEMDVVGINPDRGLVEIVELPEHPFFIGVQFHPEFKSRPLDAHPIFRGFVGAALAHSRGESRVKESSLA